MNIEIVEAYPFLDHKNKWSVHVYLIDLDADIRGVMAIKTKSSWFVKMPFRVNLDQDTKQKIAYPVFSFTDKEKNKKLTEIIKEKTIEYISKQIQDLSKQKKSKTKSKV